MVGFGEIGTDLGGAGVVQRRIKDADTAVLQGFAEPCVQFARGFVEVVALAHGDSNMGLADEGLPFFPCVQLHQAVAAHQPPQLRAGKLLAEDLDGVKRISRAVADDVAVAGGEFRLVGDGKFNHIEALLCRRARAVFVIRVACRQEDDEIQTDFVGEGAGDVEVAVVNGVKRAAE